MRLGTIALILLTITTALPADDNLAQDGVENAAGDVADDVAENPAKAEDKVRGISRLFFFISFVLTAVIIVLIIIEKVKQASARERLRLLEAAASELGLSVQPEGDSTLQEELSPFPLFNIGRSREMRNLIVADTPEVSLLIFDYKYIPLSDKEGRDRWQTVVAVRSPELQIPTFHLYPEGFFSKIGSGLGGQDIDFDDHPEFSNAFVLKSEAEDETRDFFNQPLLDFFAQHPDITFEARPGTILYFRSRKRIDRIEPTATALRKFMDEGLQTFHAVRDRVTE